MRAILLVKIGHVNNTHTWSSFITAVLAGDTNASMASRVGTSPATVGRWISGTVSTPDPRIVVTVARAYGVNPATALIAAGYLSAKDIEFPAESNRELNLSVYTDLEIAQELVRRIENGQSEMPEFVEPMEDNQLFPEVVESIDAPAVGGTDEDPSKMTDEEVQTNYGLIADTSDPEQDLDERTP